MKLYHKQLDGLEALKREQYVLNYVKKRGNDLPSFRDTTTSPGKINEITGLAEAAFSLLGSKSILSAAITLAPLLLNRIRSQKNNREQKNPIESIAKEVFFGYLKWKAIQMIYRQIKRMISKNSRQA